MRLLRSTFTLCGVRLFLSLRLGFVAMKKTVLMSGLALFTFWVGLSLGYHEGVNNEQRAWFSTAQVERSDQGDSKIVYTFPHTKVSVNWLEPAAANRPDPRTYKKYGHFEP